MVVFDHLKDTTLGLVYLSSLFKNFSLSLLIFFGLTLHLFYSLDSRSKTLWIKACSVI